MDWKITLHPVRGYRRWADGRARGSGDPPEQAGPEPAADELKQPDAPSDPATGFDAKRVIAARRQAERAEMLELVARATKRTEEDERDQWRLGSMEPALRWEYRRLCWEALHPDLASWMTPEQLEWQYEQFRLSEWEERTSARIASLSPRERLDRFRAEESLNRYRSGLPPRDDDECGSYREWAQLDAEVIEEHVANVLRSQQEPEAYVSGADPDDDTPPWATDLADEQHQPGSGVSSSPDAKTWLPGPAGAGSGLEQGPIAPFAPVPRDQRDATPKHSPLITPPDADPPDLLTRPDNAPGPQGPIPGPP